MYSLSKTKSKFDKYSDSDLIKIIRDRNNTDSSNDATDILIERYRKIIQFKATDYNLTGFERDDLVQEGLIGLLDAINSYSPNRNSSFKTYANVCIDNKLKKLVARATSNKYSMVTGSLTEFTDDLESSELDNPERIYAGKESWQMIAERSITYLSEFEHRVLMLYLEGYNYKKIAKILDASSKSVDNAMQRVRKKLRSIVGNPDFN